MAAQANCGMTPLVKAARTLRSAHQVDKAAVPIKAGEAPGEEGARLVSMERREAPNQRERQRLLKVATQLRIVAPVGEGELAAITQVAPKVVRAAAAT